MNLWLAAAIALTVALFGVGWTCSRGSTPARLAGLELASVLTFLLLLVLTEGLHRQPFLGAAVTLALASFIGSLALARFLERWL